MCHIPSSLLSCYNCNSIKKYITAYIFLGKVWSKLKISHLKNVVAFVKIRIKRAIYGKSPRDFSNDFKKEKSNKKLLIQLDDNLQS